MSKDSLRELKILIMDVILRGYIYHILFSENFMKDYHIVDENAFYIKFIRMIYGSDPSEMEPVIRNIYEISVKTAMDPLREYLKLHKMRRGFWFFNKTELIIYYYPIVGFALRDAEVR